MSNPPPSDPASRSGNRTTLFVVGTAALLLAGGIVYQVYQAKDAEAQTETGDAPGTASLGKNLAMVNGYPITWDQVARECVQRSGPEVLDNIINRTLIQQECQKRGIAVTESEVTAEISRIAQRFQIPVTTWYEMLQTERNLTPKEYQADVIWPMLALKKLAGDNIKVTRQDMLNTFERDYGQMVKARMIMLNNFRRAQEVHEKATRNPDSFADLARENSIEPNSRSLGGKIPHIRRHGGNPTLEQEAFKLQPGQISGIIQMDRNYVIIKCEGFTEPVVTDMSQVKDQLFEQVKEEKTQEAVAKLFDQIRKNSRIDNFLVPEKSTRGSIRPTSGFQTPADVRPASVNKTVPPAR